jgi:hypothetical protein
VALSPALSLRWFPAWKVPCLDHPSNHRRHAVGRFYKSTNQISVAIHKWLNFLGRKLDWANENRSKGGQEHISSTTGFVQKVGFDIKQRFTGYVLGHRLAWFNAAYTYLHRWCAKFCLKYQYSKQRRWSLGSFRVRVLQLSRLCMSSVQGGSYNIFLVLKMCI